MQDDFPKAKLVSHLDFKIRCETYCNSFNSRAFPYRLPEVSYLGSFIPEIKNPSKSELYIGIPVKNQESSIFNILSSLFDSMSCNFTVGVVLDNCTDDSKKEVLRFIQTTAISHTKLQRFDLISSDGELFEATCENLLFQFCEEKLYMSLQADIYMRDVTFIGRATKAFHQNSDLLGISGRAIVSLAPNQKMAQNLAVRILSNLPNLIAPRIWKQRRLGPVPSRVGYFGDTSNHPNSSMKYSARQLETIYPGEAIIRGPLVWRSEFFGKLGGLDDLSYFLGRDDCDLSFRGWMLFKYFVAYMPCYSYSSPLEGTTRKPRAPEVLAELQQRADLSKRFKGELGLLWASELQVDSRRRLKKQIPIK